jgi:hypothetical protein
MHRVASRTIPFALASIAVVVAGCSGAGNDAAEPAPEPENVSSSTAALIEAVPKREWLAIAVAGFNTTTNGAVATTPTSATTAPPAECLPGEPARLADLSKTVSTRANGMLEAVLGVVSGVLSRPPTFQDDHHAVWGPMTGSEPAGIYRMDVERAPDGAIAFQLTARPVNVDQWRGLFRGATRVIDANHRVGDVEIDLAALHAVDPVRNTATSGGVKIHFGNADGNTAIDMMFGNATGPETPPTDAKYTYIRRPDGAGAFEFVAHTTDPSVPTEKLVVVNTAWAPGGAGKSRATELKPTAPKPMSVVECWAPNAGLVFHADDGGQAGGNPACCPADALLGP